MKLYFKYLENYIEKKEYFIADIFTNFIDETKGFCNFKNIF